MAHTVVIAQADDFTYDTFLQTVLILEPLAQLKQNWQRRIQQDTLFICAAPLIWLKSCLLRTEGFCMSPVGSAEEDSDDALIKKAVQS